MPVVAGPGIGQDLILLVASGLLLAGARRAKYRATTPALHTVKRCAGQ